MKKLFIVFALVFILAAPAMADSMTETADGYNISLEFDEGHAVMGDNHVRISIRDASGAEVTDARVKVEYSMPPMKGMVPMNYKTRARLMDEAYMAKLNLSMGGKWAIKVNAMRPDGLMIRVTYHVNIEEGASSSRMGHGGM